MAATIHREPYEVLIRKVGYSVGLEATRERTLDVVREYSAVGAITASQWADLVKVRWGLSTEHIGKVFGALNLVHVAPGAVDVGYGLDALAVLYRMLAPEHFGAATDAVLTALFLIADADVFLNCLASEFEPSDVEACLLRMINDKRNDAYKVIKLAALREKVDRIINIETQKSNKGGAAAGKGIEGLRRRESISVTEGPLARPSDNSPTISPDYLRKVPRARRDWARSVGLFDERSTTQRGRKLLNAFALRGCKYDDGAYSLWPFPPELARIYLTPEAAPWTTLDFYDFVETIEAAFRPQGGHSAAVGDVWLRSVFTHYRDLNANKAILRKELPLRVALLVQLGHNVALLEAINVKLILDSQPAAGAISLRTSRHHEGAVVIRAN